MEVFAREIVSIVSPKAIKDIHVVRGNCILFYSGKGGDDGHVLDLVKKRPDRKDGLSSHWTHLRNPSQVACILCTYMLLVGTRCSASAAFVELNLPSGFSDHKRMGTSGFQKTSTDQTRAGSATPVHAWYRNWELLGPPHPTGILLGYTAGPVGRTDT